VPPLSLLLSWYRARFLFSRVLFSLLKFKDQKRADTNEPLSGLCTQASASLDLGPVIDSLRLATILHFIEHGYTRIGRSLPWCLVHWMHSIDGRKWPIVDLWERRCASTFNALKGQ
ncbi:unnamed protein product, partial [Ixodes pacificus]